MASIWALTLTLNVRTAPSYFAALMSMRELLTADEMCFGRPILTLGALFSISYVELTLNSLVN